MYRSNLAEHDRGLDLRPEWAVEEGYGLSVLGIEDPLMVSSC